MDHFIDLNRLCSRHKCYSAFLKTRFGLIFVHPIARPFVFASFKNLSSLSLLLYAVFKVQTRNKSFRISGIVRSYERGGDSEDRTRDLLRARQALSQLSYIPVRLSVTLNQALKIEQKHSCQTLRVKRQSSDCLD